MIWSKQKANDLCKGCGVRLIDQPWIENPKKINPHQRWLLHSDTMLTICKTTKE